MRSSERVGAVELPSRCTDRAADGRDPAGATPGDRAEAGPSPSVEPVVEHCDRSKGVDLFRGAVLVYLAVLVFTPTTGWRGHAAWWGWRPSDVFFPAFLLIGGVGLAYQTRERVPWPRLLRRFVTLVILGVLVNAWLGSAADLSTLRFPGVLQRIAVVGLLGAVVVAMFRRSWPSVAIAAVVCMLAWGGLLAYSARSCPDGTPTQEGCATFLWLDERAFDSDHVYQRGTAGHDPEGIASTIGALATFLAGYSAGRLVSDLRNRPILVRVGALAAMAAGWLVLTPLALAFAPFGKRMWTPAFVSLNAAAGLAALAALVCVFDADYRRASVRIALGVVAWPFEAVGRNALVLWIALFVVDHALAVTPTEGGATLGPHLLAVHGPGGYIIILGGVWLALALLMHAANWHVRL